MTRCVTSVLSPTNRGEGDLYSSVEKHPALGDVAHADIGHHAGKDPQGPLPAVPGLLDFVHLGGEPGAETESEPEGPLGSDERVEPDQPGVPLREAHSPDSETKP